MESLNSNYKLVKDLAEQVTDKVQGVFLWVYLVIRSLREGLTNGDSLADLHRRIEALPANLESFFKHILVSVDRFYHKRMCRIFQVAMCSPKPVELIIYPLLDDDLDHNADIHVPSAKFTGSEIRDRLKRARRRLNGRYKGLLEVHINKSMAEVASHRVKFLHRTVRDFFCTKEMKNFFEAQDDVFNPYFSTFKAYVRLIQSFNFSIQDMANQGLMQSFLRDSFYFARNVKPDLNHSPVDQLDELDHTLELVTSQLECGVSWYRLCYNDEYGVPSCKTFLEFAVQTGLRQYINNKLRGGRLDIETKSRLLYCALIGPTNQLGYLAVDESTRS
ncbi:hypothetical protein F4677DRAFT_460429 [Hypoxylon crocopeplum]|nr:hypothetical protein F4677DRAFT_460429 [Hypoxylon crocopeplum]